MSRLLVMDGKLLAKQTAAYLDPEAFAAWVSKVKSVPGGHWDKVRRAWVFPTTSEVAMLLHAALPDAEVTRPVQDLLDAAKRARGAQAHKTATKLDPIPLTVLKPWHHQLRAYHFAKAMPAAMLAMEMRTGKSRVVIDLVINLCLDRVLILCPTSVVDVWESEFEKHAAMPMRVLKLGKEFKGTVAKKAKILKTMLATPGPLAVVVNFESAWRTPLAGLLTSQQWPLVVLDESHRIKAAGSKVSLFVARLRDHATKRLCLTGTPMPHSPLDVYGQYRFLEPGVFGTSVTAFRAKFAMMGGYLNKQIVAWRNEEELSARFHSLAFTVKAGDVFDLPPTQDLWRKFELNAAERRVYDQLEHEAIAEVKAGIITVSNALVKLLRLQTISSGFVKVEDSQGHEFDTPLGTSKRDLFADVLEDLPQREPVVVFCRFHEDLNAVIAAARAQGRSVAELSGRINQLKLWQAGAADVLAAQIQSGGVGVDLSRACFVFFYSLTFSLGDFEQARARVLGQAQKRAVAYYFLVAKDTVDETILQALEDKADTVERVLAAWKTK